VRHQHHKNQQENGLFSKSSAIDTIVVAKKSTKISETLIRRTRDASANNEYDSNNSK
jgi:hypothetical protein